MYALLSWRHLQKHRLRTLLSALAVALGVATAVVADVTGAAIRSAGQGLIGSQGTVAFAGDFVNSGLGIMALAILTATAFFIFSALAMAVTQRQQQIGALRALGVTRWQTLGLIVLEAVMTGAAGTLLGLLLGPLLGRGFISLLARLANFAHGQIAVAPTTLLRAATLGVTTTLVSMLLPAWRATRIEPLQAIRSQDAEGLTSINRRATAAGVVLLIGLTLFLLLSPPAPAVLAPPWDILLAGLLTICCLTGLGLLLPLVIELVGRGVAHLAVRRGVAGRLAADNLRRARARVARTTATLFIALMAVVAVMGITTFLFEVTITQLLERFDIDWIAGPITASPEGSIVNWEVLSKWDLATMRLSRQFVADLQRLATGRANLVRVPQVVIPELALMSGLPSFVADPTELRQSGLFAFSEGDWDTAQPLMETGCALLLTARMARQHDTWLYDTLILPGVDGPVTCTVAGLGTSAFMGTSIVSAAAAAELGMDLDNIFVVIIQPVAGADADTDTLRKDIGVLLEEYPSYSLIEVEPFFEDVSAMVDILKVMLNGMLLLAILAAALGVVNTTLLSVNERSQELSLLRAVGATRRQVSLVVTGEAALMGLIGGAMGLAAGLALTGIFVAVIGGNMWGFSDLPLWPSAWSSMQPAIATGILGILIAPLLCAGAAWLPARAILQRPILEALDAGRRF